MKANNTIVTYMHAQYKGIYCHLYRVFPLTHEYPSQQITRNMNFIIKECFPVHYSSVKPIRHRSVTPQGYFRAII